MTGMPWEVPVPRKVIFKMNSLPVNVMQLTETGPLQYLYVFLKRIANTQVEGDGF